MARMHRFHKLRSAIRTRAHGVSSGGHAFASAPRGRPSTRGTKMTFRTAADSDRVHARKGERKRRENAASDRNKSAQQQHQQQQEQQQPLLQPIATRRCIDACANITRSPRARWIGRLMPAICGYCCYLTVTLCAARCRELRQGTAPREGPESRRCYICNINMPLLEESIMSLIFNDNVINNVINLINNL